MIFMPSSLEAKSPRLKANKKSIAAYSKGLIDRGNRVRQLENAIGHLEQVRRLISHGN